MAQRKFSFALVTWGYEILACDYISIFAICLTFFSARKKWQFIIDKSLRHGTSKLGQQVKKAEKKKA